MLSEIFSTLNFCTDMYNKIVKLKAFIVSGCNIKKIMK